MTYRQALDFIEETKQYGSILGLISIRNLMQELGDVQETLPILHIAGTNGKGSVGAMLNEVLTEAGFRVGRYSSPSVFDYREIIQLNGAYISEEAFTGEAERVKTACERLTAAGIAHPTSFEVETAIAFLFFADEKCDIVLLETGLGGITDATNLIQHPLCSIITSISMDHMAFLGDSLSEIAAAKAGIIKTGCPVVSAKQDEEVMCVIRKKAAEEHAALTEADRKNMTALSYHAGGMHFSYKGLGTVELGLTGEFQAVNAACALEVLRLLQSRGYLISKEAIKTGLAHVKWQGRFEQILDKPVFMIDGAHNEGAARALAKSIENCFTNRRITYIIGVLADKEHDKILKELLPLAERVYTVTPDNPRALPAEQLALEALQYHKHVTAAESVENAVKRAYSRSSASDVIVAFGSLSYLAQVKHAVNKLCK